METSKTLLLASNNRGKLVEMTDILAGLPYSLVLPADVGIQLDVVEDGSTYAENASKKALAFFDASQQVIPGGLLTLADDSGLEVDALGGEPGLYSARYAGSHDVSDHDRRMFLIERLMGLPRSGRTGWKARFRATVAIVGPGVALHLFEGECPGEVITEERGSGGFGYDPIFFLPEYGQTMAELGTQVKNQISHRARSLQAAIPFLREISMDGRGN
jgi:XTP/dITP diphosphohydrolase